MFRRKRQTACERIREMFSPYIDGQLPDIEKEVVDFHVDICDACRYQLTSMEKTAKLLQNMPVVPVPRSFTLAEAPVRGIQLPFAMPSMNWRRVAMAAAIIALVTLVAIDVTGVIDESDESVVASPTPTPTEDVQPTPTDVSPQPTQDVIVPDTMPPDPSDDQFGIAQDLSVLDAQQEADPRDGVEEEGLSPTPPPHSPSWLLPLEIITGILVVILGAAYYLVWQRKREFSTTNRG